MRVAMVDPSLFSPEYDAALCDALGGLGHAVALVARPPRSGEPLRPGRYTLVPHFYRHSERIRARFPRGYQYAKGAEHAADLARLPGVLADLRPDVVHVQWPVLASLDRLAVRRFRRRWPTVLTVHNTTPFHASPHSRAQNVGVERFMHEFDALVTHGRFSADALGASGRPPVEIVPHGLLGAAETSVGAGRRHNRDRHLDLLCFGRVRTYKGIDVLVDAIGMLPPEIRNRIRLTVAGVPEQPIDPLRDAADRWGVADQIRWDLRFVPDAEVDTLFEGADLAVLPYREVDASGVLMKAIAHATPVVATRVGVFADLLGGSEAGLLVEPGDAQSLSATLAGLARDPAQLATLRAGAETLRDGYPSWADIAACTVDVYRRTVRRRASVNNAATRPA